LQAITSIAVHPTTAHLFCTTSRDHTTRIYDLTLLIIEAKKKDKGKKKKEDRVSNPHWPPSKVPSFAGAPHGLHLRPSELEDEGRGIGRCIAVLMGGRSGGHFAAVLGAVNTNLVLPLFD
jgi:polycomb protein EED